MKSDFKLFISNTCEAMPSKVWGKMIFIPDFYGQPICPSNKDNYRLVWIWKIYQTLFLTKVQVETGSNKKVPTKSKEQWKENDNAACCPNTSSD